MSTSLYGQLSRAVRGDVRFDRLTRAIYATDASIYEIVPRGVVLPRDRDDVVTAVNLCREHGVSVVPRGAGTGLTGGAVGSGVQIDCARYMNRISDLDVDARTVRVGAGVVLDELNAVVSPHGLHFAPDVATSSRATIGGMIANNSCGVHSIRYGRTVDHVRALTVVLADGSVATWSDDGRWTGVGAERIVAQLGRIASAYRSEVRARFPKVLRRNGGYALDRICETPRVNPVDIVCGSEGTLCVIVEAVLGLTPLPRHTALLLVHFAELFQALDATPLMLEHGPSAVELLDAMLLEAARHAAVRPASRALLDDRAAAVLIVEWFGRTRAEVEEHVRRAAACLDRRRIGYARLVITDPGAQRDVWALRKGGLGLLTSQPGERRTCAFVEDTAVHPDRLRAYIERFQEILRQEGVEQTSYYAHASVGVIHVRPALDLKSADDVRRMHRVADRVSSLALEFGGANTGEHGDGLVRSCWIEKMYGPTIVRALGEVKRTFDPQRLFNPGKIVEPAPMTDNLRYGPDYAARTIKTHLDFSRTDGPAGLAERCTGIGRCRQRRVGVMCPSFMATGDETHSTRGRANALRAALSNRNLLDGLDDRALEQAMDLCLLCKACKTECPAGVDMARLKVEWLAQRHLRYGVPRRDRFVGRAAELAAVGARVPRLANAMLQARPVRGLLERWYGIDRRIAPPRLARTTFRQWLARRRRQQRATYDNHLPDVVYFVDTWTNFYTPQVGIAAVTLLEAAGFNVLTPRLECCGRPFISKGLLTQARRRADANVAALARFADTQTPIVGTEPSCILTLVDEYPQLLRTADARAVAALARTLESFLDAILRRDSNRLRFTPVRRRILYHAHCHQKAIVGTDDAIRLLNTPTGLSAELIDAGCCGMAGSFGHEKEHYDIASAIGAERLFPAIRGRGQAHIAVSGFSCRQQVAHHTGVQARHPVEYLAELIEPFTGRDAVPRSSASDPSV